MCRIVGLFECSSDEAQRLIAALAESCGLRIRTVRAGDKTNDLSGLILVDPIQERLAGHWPASLPTIHVRMSETVTSASRVTFPDRASGPRIFRGRTVVTEAVVPDAKAAGAGDALAVADGQPVWWSASDSGVRHDVCWVRRPWLKEGDCVFEHLNGKRFLSLLPLVDWLRHVSDWSAWQQPPVRACFMFDDPNLHSSRFGFISFKELAAEGNRHRYHTAFATVPLDAWFFTRPAAQLLQRNRQSLSLLVHGNNHTHKELASNEPPEFMAASMQQAIYRIAALERKAGVRVARVMIPPHGACTAATMRSLVQAGFDAASISHGSVRAANRGADWPQRLGIGSVSVINGLPVIPRFPLGGSPENTVLLAAYLNQPIIPMGHHWDLADGVACLANLAQFINGLGSVNWTDMSSIAQSNYSWKIEGGVLRIRSESRRADVHIPDGITQLSVEAPWLEPNAETIHCRTQRGEEIMLPLQTENGRWRLDRPPLGSVELVVSHRTTPSTHAKAHPQTPFRAVGRRLLVEIRDRTMPYLPRRFVKR